MLAKISSGKSVFGVLAYNKIKVEDNQADVLYSQKMFDSPDGKFSIRNCMDSFAPYLAMNNRTEKTVFHASLNPDPKDKLSDKRLSELAQSYMEKLGYGNQPYIVDFDKARLCHSMTEFLRLRNLYRLQRSFRKHQFLDTFFRHLLGGYGYPEALRLSATFRSIWKKRSKGREKNRIKG